MKTDQLKNQLADIGKKLQPVLKHYPFIAAIVLLGFAIYVVFTVSQILQVSDDPEYRTQKEQAETVINRFDPKAVKEVNSLRASDSSAPITIDGQTRANPFN